MGKAAEAKHPSAPGSVVYSVVLSRSSRRKMERSISLLFYFSHGINQFHHNLILLVKVPNPCELSGCTHTSNVRLYVPTSPHSIRACIFIKSRGGANEALLILEGPDPAPFTPAGDYSCD